MAKWFFGLWLGIQVVCRRIELDPELLLAMWQQPPRIEIYDQHPGSRQTRLAAQVDAMFPF